jgi:hypothetical protein
MSKKALFQREVTLNNKTSIKRPVVAAFRKDSRDYKFCNH